MCVRSYQLGAKSLNVDCRENYHRDVEHAVKKIFDDDVRSAANCLFKVKLKFIQIKNKGEANYLN